MPRALRYDANCFVVRGVGSRPEVLTFRGNLPPGKDARSERGPTVPYGYRGTVNLA